ncbi:hypothetical protein ATO4_15701 [Aurantimonas sp. 22II-16-19i]|nr:hypothetical protein ATO4_15701 [Aurantimonas sp. 22II-16-19i]
MSWREINATKKALAERFPGDPFLPKLLKGVMRVARDKSNPIRGNLAASGLREIVGHVLHDLAPEQEVRRCVWFEQAKDTAGITRRQRANYIVHAGLPEAFVEDILSLDVREEVQPLLDAINELNRATHVQAETIIHKGRDVRKMIQNVLFGLVNLLEGAATARETMKHALAEVMHEAVFDNLISETIQELDELSTHTVVNGHAIDTIAVQLMNATTVCYVVTGEVEVELQYGSNSDVRNDIGFRRNDAYPYRAIITSCAAEPSEIHSNDVALTVDNRSFFE